KSGPLREKIEEIKKNHDAPTERIEASVKFVQNEIRYLGLEGGIGAYQPFPPEKVLIQRFGDCKDKSLLLATMLQNMDIQAYPALVSTYEGHTIHTRPPSPISFNHCIVQV